MAIHFDLSLAQLLEIAAQFKQKIVDGLRVPDQELQCLPTFVPICPIPPNGRALVLDFGGTNVRAAVVSLQDGHFTVEQGPVTSGIPIQRGVPLERARFLASFADLIASLKPPQHLPLGYCFSYPTASTPDGDARLIKWTKEVFVNETVEQKMGHLLTDYLATYHVPTQCANVTVINDTVAALLAGMTALPADGYIGLIVGTGTNLATLLEPAQMPKFPTDITWRGSLPVNLESGNFRPPHLTEWDDRLDAQSEHPGYQRFEKAVSGVYLATLLKFVRPASAIDPKIGSKAVVELAEHAPANLAAEQALARAILARSAKLVAASLTGLIEILHAAHPRRTICIAAEGGLFWGYPAYREIAQTTLVTLLAQVGFPDIAVQFVSVPHANLLGSAVAALAPHTEEM